MYMCDEKIFRIKSQVRYREGGRVTQDREVTTWENRHPREVEKKRRNAGIRCNLFHGEAQAPGFILDEDQTRESLGQHGGYI